MSALLFALILCVAMMGATTMPAKAEEYHDVDQGDFSLRIWDYEGGASIVVMSYKGTAATVQLPASVTYNGKTYTAANADFALGGSTGATMFKNNTAVKKVLVPSGYYMIGVDAFEGCANLEEVVVSKTVQSIGINAFLGCEKLKTYRLDCRGITYDVLENDPGIGQNDSNDIIAGVKAYVIKDSKIDEYLKALNQRSREKGGNEIEIIYSTDPAAEADSKVLPTSAPVDKTKLKGKDGTFYGAGASKEAVNKALTTLKGEKDQKGMVFNKLRLKAKKVAKTSITLGWSKPSGTVQFVLYGNKCGKTNKYVKIKELKKTSFAVKKVNGKAVKKGTYYKFVIVALDKSGKVVSTSKTIHVATNGGKFTNFKSVTTKAKKSGKFKAVSKLSVKKGKKVPLKTKAVKLSKKMKAQTHVAIRYESTNTKVATVTAKGVIKGVKKGKCKVYAYAQNGVFKAVTVTVK
jgi:hypothetical protein